MHVHIVLVAVGNNSEEYFCLIVYSSEDTESQKRPEVLNCCHPLEVV